LSAFDPEFTIRDAEAGLKWDDVNAEEEEEWKHGEKENWQEGEAIEVAWPGTEAQSEDEDVAEGE
jgi:hypothetical protein